MLASLFDVNDSFFVDDCIVFYISEKVNNFQKIKYK